MAKKKEPKITYTVVDGKKYPNQFRDSTGIHDMPKGKYVTEFGKTKNIPKPKKKKMPKINLPKPKGVTPKRIKKNEYGTIE